ncbi:hypothetical protein [Bradyrhizobium sp. 930_D9_N1_4]|uniref:hypothetical protein n=1 Tax=Bradyrhizobium sp. 930_D9_N1_4 TaxID=3240374 RepID=UPI003F8CDCC8
MSEMAYRPGDFWRICEVCGFKYRASQTNRRWDGLIVCHDDWETRHPQDFVRGRKDLQNVPDPRPEPLDNVIGPLTTALSAAATASSSTILVNSSVRFLAEDSIGVMLTGGMKRFTILFVPDEASLILTTQLGDSAPAGSAVINYSAISEPDIG